MARVLVADDEEGIRSFLAEALELDGHEVEQAADGAEALSMLRERSFDVLLTDLKMPALDGMGLLAHVRAEQPETEVIVLTAHGTVANAVEAMRKELDGIKVRGKRCPRPIRRWAQCGLSDRLLAAIERQGFVRPFPIQAQALPAVMSGRDVIGIAKTGSGKTMGYALPMLRHILDQPPLGGHVVNDHDASGRLTFMHERGLDHRDRHAGTIRPHQEPLLRMAVIVGIGRLERSSHGLFGDAEQ